MLTQLQVLNPANGVQMKSFLIAATILASLAASAKDASYAQIACRVKGTKTRALVFSMYGENVSKKVGSLLLIDVDPKTDVWKVLEFHENLPAIVLWDFREPRTFRMLKIDFQNSKKLTIISRSSTENRAASAIIQSNLENLYAPYGADEVRCDSFLYEDSSHGPVPENSSSVLLGVQKSLARLAAPVVGC